MQIRDHYIEAFEKIRRRYGERSCGYRISPHVPLKDTIGYTGEYVVGHNRDHYRYEYYWNTLDRALKMLRKDRRTNQRAARGRER